MRVFVIVALALLPLALGSLTRFKRNDVDPMDFTGHKVIRIQPKSLAHVEKLMKMQEDFEMDYWNPALPDLRPVLTIVDQQREQFFLRALNQSNIGYEVVHSNYQQVVDNEKLQMEIAARSVLNRNEDYDYENSYHTYDEVVSQIKFLANKYPNQATYQSVGNSYEGREIPAIIVGSGSKVIFFECGIHSREWVTVAFGQWVTNKLLSDATLSSYLTTFKFVIVPVLNVDGFYLTHNGNRLWRKTRSKQSGTTCLGADPNRNWDSAFCQTGASTNPCSETYCGVSAFSEVEAKQMADLINQYKSQTVAYFAIHSYSQLWMYPWGYTKTLPPNAAELKAHSQAALAAIKGVNGLAFTEGSIANAIYLAAGSSADWAYDAAGIKISFALELRDKGQYGFQLPANQIKPAMYETWAGIKAVLDRL